MPVCLHPDCHEEIPKGKHACRYHWRQLPKEIKRPIVNARFYHAPMSLKDAIGQAEDWLKQQDKII
ncbi:MAG: hypothetical protein JKY45_03240 [Emcibacter sp.]|nr:hypothetical protein [Emcibacter sp.]